MTLRDRDDDRPSRTHNPAKPLFFRSPQCGPAPRAGARRRDGAKPRRNRRYRGAAREIRSASRRSLRAPRPAILKRRFRFRLVDAIGELELALLAKLEAELGKRPRTRLRAMHAGPVRLAHKRRFRRQARSPFNPRRTPSARSLFSLGPSMEVVLM